MAVLDDDRRSQEHGRVIDANLKYDFSGLAPVILVPQPSDDPKDPLVSLRAPSTDTDDIGEWWDCR